MPRCLWYDLQIERPHPVSNLGWPVVHSARFTKPKHHILDMSYFFEPHDVQHLK